MSLAQARDAKVAIADVDQHSLGQCCICAKSIELFAQLWHCQNRSLNSTRLYHKTCAKNASRKVCVECQAAPAECPVCLYLVDCDSTDFYMTDCCKIVYHIACFSEASEVVQDFGCPTCRTTRGSVNKPMQLFVKDLEGKTQTLDMVAADSIRKLKNVIQSKIGLSPCKQRLMYAGRILEDHWWLSHYNIAAEANLVLVVNLPGS
jgi:Ubiquitin family